MICSPRKAYIPIPEKDGAGRPVVKEDGTIKTVRVPVGWSCISNPANNSGLRLEYNVRWTSSGGKKHLSFTIVQSKLQRETVEYYDSSAGELKTAEVGPMKWVVLSRESTTLTGMLSALTARVGEDRACELLQQALEQEGRKI